MKYLHFPPSDPQGAKNAWRKYREHMLAIEPKLPPLVRAFASQVWYYDPNDHRCPHDAWLKSLTIEDTEDGSSDSQVNITVRLLGAYHDRTLTFGYQNIRCYRLSRAIGPSAKARRTDWLFDEFDITDDRLVTHQIDWSDGSTWYFECQDITFSDSALI